MTIERVEQNRDIGIYEVNVAINNPFEKGLRDFAELDTKIEEFLDAIEQLLGGMFE